MILKYIPRLEEDCDFNPSTGELAANNAGPWVYFVEVEFLPEKYFSACVSSAAHFWLRTQNVIPSIKHVWMYTVLKPNHA